MLFSSVFFKTIKYVIQKKCHSGLLAPDFWVSGIFCQEDSRRVSLAGMTVFFAIQVVYVQTPFNL